MRFFTFLLIFTGVCLLSISYVPMREVRHTLLYLLFRLQSWPFALTFIGIVVFNPQVGFVVLYLHFRVKGMPRGAFLVEGECLQL